MSSKKFLGLKPGEGQTSMFSVVKRRGSTWTPPEPPSLAGIRDVYVDFETNGLRWQDKQHKILGAAVSTPDGRTWYLPDGHRGGGNLGDGVLKRWMQQELRDKYIININSRFDNHMAHGFDVDLEAQGCLWSDIAHYAALLDDHRSELIFKGVKNPFSLNSISLDYVGEGKETELSMKDMEEYHAGEVEGYARNDVRLVRLCREKMMPLLAAQDLLRVQELEDKVIFPVCEMERNGAPIDVDLLKKWCARTEQQYMKQHRQLCDDAGMNLNPKSTGDCRKLFDKLGLTHLVTLGDGTVSFEDIILKNVDHPHARALRSVRKLGNLRSKYLVNYRDQLQHSNILRYALHQLRGKPDEGQGGGAITGRFSSSRFGTGEEPDGVNIQQVQTNEKIRAAFGFEADDNSHDDELYLIRRLFKPENGLWLCADADQIEYRIFADLSAAPVVLKAYADDPHANFHKIVQAMIVQTRPGFPYRRTKDVNFAKVFGAGLKRISQMMECSIPDAKNFVDEYDRMLPEVDTLIKSSIKQAVDQGFVTSLLGRRSRFPGQERIHKALNSIIQPSAADIMKIKLVELHAERKRTGFKLRFSVHDEVNGDIPDVQGGKMVEEILNRQAFPLKVPITWKVGTGRTWAEAK